jgi:hypothetical protein
MAISTQAGPTAKPARPKAKLAQAEPLMASADGTAAPYLIGEVLGDRDDTGGLPIPSCTSLRRQAHKNIH